MLSIELFNSYFVRLAELIEFRNAFVQRRSTGVVDDLAHFLHFVIDRLRKQ